MAVSTTTSNSPITVTRADAVATVTIANPPVNAMSERVLVDLASALAAVDRDRATRAVVLASDGPRAFVAGADVTELQRMIISRQVLDEHIELARVLFETLSGLRVPLIAAVSAAAMGGGFEILLTCDLVVAEEGVLFGLPEVRLGLIPGAGGTQRLTRRLGVARASDLIMRGKTFDCQQALELGLVQEIVAPGGALEAAQRLAAQLAKLPARAVQEAKRVIRAGADLSLAEGLQLERDAFRALFATSDAVEGISAFVEKREARFVHE
jgi:enoyl-CoA hydratase